MALNDYIKYCFIKGSEREEECKNYIESLGEGYVMKKTEYIEDRFKHMDFRLYKDNQLINIFDFKGNDKEGHEFGMDGYTWIETKNVEGNIGWFYAKNIDSLMFELPDRYILVDIFPLREFCNKILGYVNERSVNKPLNDYVLYKRNDRFDEIFRMPFSHIEKYIIKIFYK